MRKSACPEPSPSMVPTGTEDSTGVPPPSGSVSDAVSSSARVSTSLVSTTVMPPARLGPRGPQPEDRCREVRPQWADRHIIDVPVVTSLRGVPPAQVHLCIACPRAQIVGLRATPLPVQGRSEFSIHRLEGPVSRVPALRGDVESMTPHRAGRHPEFLPRDHGSGEGAQVQRRGDQPVLQFSDTGGTAGMDHTDLAGCGPVLGQLERVAVEGIARRPPPKGEQRGLAVFQLEVLGPRDRSGLCRDGHDEGRRRGACRKHGLRLRRSVVDPLEVVLHARP